MKRMILLICFLIIPVYIFSQVLFLYGGTDHKVFLGCLNSNKYDSDSIWNKHGTYGSKYSADSIWNKYGTYGSKYNSLSPWNRYSSDPPVVVDKYGKFYGYFTSNKYLTNRTNIKWLLWILDNYEIIVEDTELAYEELFP